MKKIKFKIKLILKPGKANPSPPVGPILGQYGINIMEFCNKFNNLSKFFKFEFVNTKIIIFIDNTYEIFISTESVSNLTKKILNINKFSKKPGREKNYLISFDKINHLSIKRLDFEKKPLISIRKMILGTMISFGIYYE